MKPSKTEVEKKPRISPQEEKKISEEKQKSNFKQKILDVKAKQEKPKTKEPSVEKAPSKLPNDDGSPKAKKKNSNKTHQ